MKHKFGLKQTFFVAMLAVAGLFGASATIVNKQIEENATVEKAKAASSVSDEHIYVILIDRADGAGYTWDPEPDGSPKVHFTYPDSGNMFHSDCAFGNYNDVITYDSGTFSLGSDSSSLEAVMTKEGTNYGVDGQTCRWYSYSFPWYLIKIKLWFVSANGSYTTNYVTVEKGTKDKRYVVYGSDFWKKTMYERTDHEGSIDNLNTPRIDVTFNTNQGSTAPSSLQVRKFGKITKPSNPTKTNFTFWKWTNGNSSSNPEFDFTAPNTSSSTISLYAQWHSNPVITKYAVVDGAKEASSIGSDSVEYNETYEVPKGIFRSGYAFGGWFTNEACTTPYTDTALTANISLYAKYTSHGVWEGTVNVDLWQSGWADLSAKYAVFLMDKTTYSSEVTQWTALTGEISSGVRLLTFSYSLPFEPLKMTIVRFKTSTTTPDWDSGDMLNQTQDIDVTSMVRIGDTKDGENKNYSYSGFPKVMGGDPWAQKGSLEYVKQNDSNHVEYYGTVSLAQWEKFNIQRSPYDDGDYSSYAQTTFHSGIADKFQDGSNGTIQAKVAIEVTVYFDSFNKTLYVTTVAAAAADEWAQYFLNNVGCDETGVNLPTGWSACATEYGKLSGDAKNIVYKATADPDGGYVEKAVARYDQAIRSHPSLSHFIVNSSSTQRTVTAVRSFSPFEIALGDSETNFATIIIIVASSVSLLSITALSVLVIKKRKEKQQ